MLFNSLQNAIVDLTNKKLVKLQLCIIVRTSHVLHLLKTVTVLCIIINSNEYLAFFSCVYNTFL